MKTHKKTHFTVLQSLPATIMGRPQDGSHMVPPKTKKPFFNLVSAAACVVLSPIFKSSDVSIYFQRKKNLPSPVTLKEKPPTNDNRNVSLLLTKNGR